MSVLTKNNFIKANGLMSYSDVNSADIEVLQQTATDMGYDEFSYNDSGDLLLKKTEEVGSYTYVTTFNCRTEDVSVTVTEASPNIVFADPDVKAIVANAFGTDGEITEEQAAAVTTFMSGDDSSTNKFRSNLSVNSFDEFAYFTGVTEIGDNTFKGCLNMTSITIPANVTSIGESAFNTCESLTTVTIPSSVSSISNSAFLACTKLTSVTCEATTPPTYVPDNYGVGIFFNTNDCPIYVPAASVDAYKAAEGWSTYADRIQAIA